MDHKENGFYHIQTEDIYKDIEKHKNLYDLSEYDKNHFLYDPTNKKVIGKFKDEYNGVPISEFVGLRSKMYCVKTENKESKKLKGIKKNVVKKEISFNDYKRCLFSDDKNDICQYSSFNSLRSFQHEIKSVSNYKISLCSSDDKRYLLDDKINTLAYGHYKIINK